MAKILFLLSMMLFVAEAFSQQDSIKTKNYTYLYVAPLPLINSYVGSSFRYGIVQDLGRKFAFFGEASRFINNQRYYKDLEGRRFEVGARYYLNASNEASEWVSVGVGFLDQAFSRKGTLFHWPDTLETPMTARMTRKSEFINFGIGMNKKFARFFYIEIGVHVGFRHRDVDVAGMTESEDDYFRVKTRVGLENAAMMTDDTYVPDLAGFIKLGCCFSVWESRKRV